MAVITGITGLTRPADRAQTDTGTGHRGLGITLAVVGWLAGMAGLVIAILAGLGVTQGVAPDRIAALEGLGFGVAVAALGTAKTGIALVLWGIVRRIWVRVGSIQTALPALCEVPPAPSGVGTAHTPFGTASATQRAPSARLIDRMARVLWLPMLAMGFMALYAGLILAIVGSQSEATNPALARSLRAWTQGTQFLGEGLLLSAISFLLGTILAAIRSGGGEVQEHLGVTVHTLRMPGTAKIFVGLMALGLMVEMAQFVLYAYAATIADARTFATYSTWLGPFRELGLGVLLSGIVFALATIAKALGFQFARVCDLIRTGR